MAKQLPQRTWYQSYMTATSATAASPLCYSEEQCIATVTSLEQLLDDPGIVVTLLEWRWGFSHILLSSLCVAADV